MVLIVLARQQMVHHRQQVGGRQRQLRQKQVLLHSPQRAQENQRLHHQRQAEEGRQDPPQVQGAGPDLLDQANRSGRPELLGEILSKIGGDPPFPRFLFFYADIQQKIIRLGRNSE